MPMRDMKCKSCGAVFDMFVRPGEERICTCGGELEAVWITGHANSVIGDECDIYVKHGLCHKNGEPRRFTSKTEMKREAEKRGFTNVVEHKGFQGRDTSPHTTKWI